MVGTTMIGVRVVMVFMVTLVMLDNSREETTAIEMGEGIFLEKNYAIVYEATMPIIYDIVSVNDGSVLKMEDSTKWSKCFKNQTCILGKTLSDFKRGVEVEISKLEPKMWEDQRRKRFNIIGWLLKECCGVASQDDFETLYRGQDRLEEHVDQMKNSLKKDHRDISQMVTNQNVLTDRYNSVLNRTRFELADVLLGQTELSAEGDIIIANLLSIFKLMGRMSQKVRKNLASVSCQNKKIPANMIDPETLRVDLQKLEEKVNAEEWTLAISPNDVGAYYGIPTAACVITKERFVVRIKVPIQRQENKIQYYDVIKIPIADTNVTCEKDISSNRILLDHNREKYAFIEDDKHCKPEINKLCKVPGRIRWRNIKTMDQDTRTICENDTAMRITHIGAEQYILTHPEVLFIKCGMDQPKLLWGLEGSHGYVKIKVPCNCMVLDKTKDIVIPKQFPCDDKWAQNVTVHHILPYEWIKNTKEAEEIIKNNTTKYQDKLNKLLSENWNITSKYKIQREDLKYEDDEDGVDDTYMKIKKKMQNYHLEWTTVITILFLIVLFRKPINIILSRMATIGETRGHVSQLEVHNG